MRDRGSVALQREQIVPQALATSDQCAGRCEFKKRQIQRKLSQQAGKAIYIRPQQWGTRPGESEQLLLGGHHHSGNQHHTCRNQLSRDGSASYI